MYHNCSSFIVVKKSNCISGIMSVEGAKNAILPIVPAALLSDGISVLHHVPDSYDVRSMIALLYEYNVYCHYDKTNKILEIDTRAIQNKKIPSSFFAAYRASTIVAGALLARFNEVWIGLPGGDRIGKRPINIHLEAFEAMGATYTYYNDYIHVVAPHGLKNAEIIFDYPSVGATQNVLLAASLIEKETTITNAAQEPEIIDMIIALRNMGVTIETCFGGIIKIKGNKNLKPFNHTAIPDRLEVGTLLLAASITKGSISIINAPAYGMQNVIKKLREIGNDITEGPGGFGITLVSHENHRGTKIKTMPYPGFPTDLQSPFMALLSVAEGESIMHETVFESRMNHAYELNKMGAQISVEYDCAKIKGVSSLNGTSVTAGDIRSCAALVLAGLVAENETIIYGVNHLLRGYSGLDEKLKLLGGNIEIIHNEQIQEPYQKEIIHTI
jgi:UDP-N-acetylglucosamine 1-carboxyvinyltransferase